MFAKTVIRQGEKIISLEKAKKELEEKNSELVSKNYYSSRENLMLIGQLDDIQEEILFILEKIEEHLTRNDYGNPSQKIARALEEVAKQKDIIEQDIKIELSNNDQLKITQ